MNSSFRATCPKCGEEMYYHSFLKTTYKNWHCYRLDDKKLTDDMEHEYDCQYEECYEVSFFCYNKECQPEEDEV
jgi:hypothetical protein